MPRGIDSDVPNKGRKGGGNFIRHIRLRTDGEFSRFWFLTDGPDVYVEEFHTIQNSGGKGPRWYEKICQASAFGQACDLCEQANKDDSDVSYARTQILIWCYELQHFYSEKPNIKGEVKKAKVGGATYWVEEVNEPRLMRISIMHRGPIKTRFDRHGTLTDRPFDWIREGAKGTTRPNYTLEPLEAEEMPDEVTEAMGTIPDLEDVALGKVEKLGGDGDEDSGKSYGTRRVATVEDDDEEEEEVGNEFTKDTADDDEPEEKPKKRSKKVEVEPEDEDDEDPFA